MTKFQWINVILVFLLSFAAYCDEDRQSWKKKSFQNVLNEFIKKEEKIKKLERMKKLR